MKYILFLNYIECSQKVLGGKTYHFLYDYLFKGIQIAVPVLLVLLIIKDMVTAVAANDDKEMKKAQSNAVKRIIAAVLIVLLPLLIQLILNLFGVMKGYC